MEQNKRKKKEPSIGIKQEQGKPGQLNSFLFPQEFSPSLFQLPKTNKL